MCANLDLGIGRTSPWWIQWDGECQVGRRSSHMRSARNVVELSVQVPRQAFRNENGKEHRLRVWNGSDGQRYSRNGGKGRKSQPRIITCEHLFNAWFFRHSSVNWALHHLFTYYLSGFYSLLVHGVSRAIKSDYLSIDHTGEWRIIPRYTDFQGVEVPPQKNIFAAATWVLGTNWGALHKP